MGHGADQTWRRGFQSGLGNCGAAHFYGWVLEAFADVEAGHRSDRPELNSKSR